MSLSLILAKGMKDISFGKLTEVYREGLSERGAIRYYDCSPVQQQLRAEQDLYQYLSEVFFASSDSYCMIVQDGTNYLSVLRLEAFEDGLLLTGLETHPDYRGKGYASTLLSYLPAELQWIAPVRVYSHVAKNNRISLRVHQKNGFEIIKHSARYLDGSADSKSYTLCLVVHSV